MPGYDSVKVGSRIKDARKRKGMTQIALAEKINISSQHISNIERGRADASIPTLIDIANELSVSADSLLCDCLEVSKESLTSEAICALSRCTEEELNKLLQVCSGSIELLEKAIARQKGDL